MSRRVICDDILNLAVAITGSDGAAHLMIQSFDVKYIINEATIALNDMPTGPKRYPEKDGEPPAEWKQILVKSKYNPNPWVTFRDDFYFSAAVEWYAEIK